MDKKDVSLLIEEDLRDKLICTEYEIITIDPTSLITSNRFDLAIKIFYLKSRKLGLSLGVDIYEEHIYLFTQGANKEPGNPKKNSIEKYHQVFDHLYKEIEKYGFNSDISLIPISQDKILLNGAHRVSVSCFFEKKIKAVILPVLAPCYDFRYFLDRGMQRKHIEVVAREFVLGAKDSYIALLWPSASGKTDELRKVIKNVIYEKNVFLNHPGAHNLLVQVYQGASWLGESSNNFRGVKGKLDECFNREGAVRVFAFQASSLIEVVAIKSKIRNLFGIGNNSIHITDTHAEAIDLAEVLFNDNSIHFLNHASPNRFLSTYENIKIVKKIIKENNISRESILLDSGMVLSAYGIREAADVDIFSLDVFDHNHEKVDTHDNELVFHGERKVNLICNPQFFFYYAGLKFISFKQLYRMKRNRGQQKDIEDVAMMECIQEHKGIIKIFQNMYASYLYYKSRLRIKIKFLVKKFLIYVKAYECMKNIRNKYVKK